MLPHLRPALVAVVVLTAAAAAPAQRPVRFARTPDISPDGKVVAFSYLGDIWTVEAIGGVARPVTMHEAHDINPVFSPDGKFIAFSSNRHGSYDVFVVPAVGGKPRRLTFDSGHDMATGWTPDGKHVVFSSSRGAAFPSQIESYIVPVEGGQERKLPLFEAKETSPGPSPKRGGEKAISAFPPPRFGEGPGEGSLPPPASPGTRRTPSERPGSAATATGSCTSAGPTYGWSAPRAAPRRGSSPS